MALKLKDKIAERGTTPKAPATGKAATQAASPQPSTYSQSPNVSKARIGKRAVVSHFSLEMHRAVNMLATSQDRTLQSLVGEALDDIFVKYGKEPFNER